MLNKQVVLLLAICWTIIIVVLSLISIGDVGSSVSIPNKDKVVHFILYFVFVILWCFYFNKKDSNTRNKAIVLTLAIAFGILMELCQGAFTKSRTPDIFDAIVNAIGAIFGLIFINYYLNKKTE